MRLSDFRFKGQSLPLKALGAILAYWHIGGLRTVWKWGDWRGKVRDRDGNGIGCPRKRKKIVE